MNRVPAELTRHLTSSQKSVLRRRWQCKNYNRNGTGDPKPIIKKAFLPADCKGAPVLFLLCAESDISKRGIFEWVIFSDFLFGKGHFPVDKYCRGNKRDALNHFSDTVFSSITGITPYAIDMAWNKTHEILQIGECGLMPDKLSI